MKTRSAVPDETTLFDRVAVLFGVGCIGAITGLALGFPLFFLTQGFLANLFGIAAAGTISFFYLPVGLGLASGLLAAIWPDHAVALLGNIWKFIVELFRSAA